MTTLTFAFTRAVARTLAPGDEVVSHPARARLQHHPLAAGGRGPGRIGGPGAVRPRRPAGSPSTRSIERIGPTDPLGHGHRRVERARDDPGRRRDRRRRARGRGPGLRRRRAPRPRTGRSTSPRSAATCSRPRRTSGTARTPACSGSHPTCATSSTPYKVRPAPDTAPERWETGTPAYEAIAGDAGGGASSCSPRAWTRSAKAEREVFAPLLEGCSPCPHVTRPRTARPRGPHPDRLLLGRRAHRRRGRHRARGGAGRGVGRAATTRSRSWTRSGSRSAAARSGPGCPATRPPRTSIACSPRSRACGDTRLSARTKVRVPSAWCPHPRSSADDRVPWCPARAGRGTARRRPRRRAHRRDRARSCR